MPNTPRLSIPYPSENQNPWWDGFITLIQSLDGFHFAAVEDRNIFLTGGGDIAWDLGTETLSWSDTLQFVTPSTGTVQSISSGSAVLTDGDFWIWTVVRGAPNGATPTTSVASQVTANETSFVVAMRVGDQIFLRNGQVLSDGDSFTAFGSSSQIKRVKSADQTKNSDDTLAIDADLQCTLPANKRYSLEALIKYDAHATPDIETGWVYPTSATMHWHWQAAAFVTALTEASTLTHDGSGGLVRISQLHGEIESGDGGTFGLRWAQDTSDANNTTLKAGTWFVLTPLD